MNPELIREREAEIVNIIGALERVSQSEDWSTLKTHVFDGVLEKLEKGLTNASQQSELNLPEIYRLQGQILWAKKYSDLDILISSYMTQLKGVRLKLNPPTSEGNG